MCYSPRIAKSQTQLRDWTTRRPRGGPSFIAGHYHCVHCTDVQDPFIAPVPLYLPWAWKEQAQLLGALYFISFEIHNSFMLSESQAKHSPDNSHSTPVPHNPSLSPFSKENTHLKYTVYQILYVNALEVVKSPKFYVVDTIVIPFPRLESKHRQRSSI